MTLLFELGKAIIPLFIIGNLEKLPGFSFILLPPSIYL
jgi:hypothetical protein